MEGDRVGGPEEDTWLSGLCLFHEHEQTLGADSSMIFLFYLPIYNNLIPISLHIFIKPSIQ